MNDAQRSFGINSDMKLQDKSSEITPLNPGAVNDRFDTKNEFYKKIRDYRRESRHKADENEDV